MRRWFLSVLLVFAASGAALAADNATLITPCGTGCVTVRAKDVGLGVQSPVYIIGDAAGNPIYGTAGAANANVLTVQGIAAMTALKVDGSGVTQPISGTVTANQGTSPWVVSGTVAATQSGTWTVQQGTPPWSVTIPQSNNTLDYDTGAGTQTMTLWGIALPASGGAVAGGTATNPVRVDPTGTTTQPVSGSVSVSNFPATQPVSGTVAATQSGSWSLAANQSVNLNQVAGSAVSVDGSNNLNVNCAAGCAGGTFNNNADAVATSATNGQSAAWLYGFNGTTFDRLRVDASKNLNVNLAANSFGTVTVSGTVTANAGTNLNTSALALDTSVNGVLLSQGSTTSGQKGSLLQGAVTTAAPTYTTAQTDPLSLTTAGALRVDGSGATQPVSGTVTANAGTGTFAVSGTVTSNQGTANTAANGWPVKLTDGTNTQAVKAASTAAAATDPSSVTQLSPNQPQLTTPLNVQGGKTNNNAAPGATNVGTLGGLANAALPSWTEGDQVTNSVDLNGGVRAVLRPPVILGSYRVAAQTAVYTALAAGSALYSFRWTDATKVCAVTRVRIMVNTTTAAAAAGMLDRDLVIVRSFTVADSGGTALTLTGNNQKMRTSQATTVVGGIQISSGNALTLGTGTADAQAEGLVAVQGTATQPVGLTIPPEDLFAYNAGQNYPIFLAQNEGFRIRIPTAMPSSIAMRSTIIVEWMEIAAAGQF